MDQLKQAKIFTGILKSMFGRRLISIVLFGSVGRGDHQPDSDVDLILVIDDLPAGRLKRFNMLEPAFDAASKKGLTASFNCHIRTPKEAQRVVVMYFDLPYDAKVLYDTNGFFKKIISGVKKRIKKNGAIRKRMGRFYYWDLKPGAHADETFEIL